MNELELENETRSMMTSDYGDNKMDKSNELNDSMTIGQSSMDEYEKALHNIKGGQ